MPFIDVNDQVPGILALLMYKPGTGEPMSAFTQALLRGPSPLTPGERELIAAYVSRGNECNFCMRSHTAATRELWEGDQHVVDSVLAGDIEGAELTPLMQALLDIADEVRERGDRVQESSIGRARAAGASDEHIHDAVLVAAAFCMFNRYVDGLRALTPEQPEVYAQIGKRLATQGYVAQR